MLLMDCFSLPDAFSNKRLAFSFRLIGKSALEASRYSTIIKSFFKLFRMLSSKKRRICFMSQPINIQLTSEDIQLVEIHQLGIPLHIYKIRSGAIFTLFVLSCFIFSLGVTSVLIIILIQFRGWPIKQLDTFFLVSLLFQGVFCLLFGLWGLQMGVPELRKKHLVICDQGFFQVDKTGWGKKVEVIRWQDIRFMKKVFCIYTIVYREHRICSLDILYQNISELTEQIKQQSKRKL